MSASSIAGVKSFEEGGDFHTDKPEKTKSWRDYVGPVSVGLGSASVLAFAARGGQSRAARVLATGLGLVGGVLAFGGVEAAKSGDNHTDTTSLNDVLAINHMEAAA